MATKSEKITEIAEHYEVIGTPKKINENSEMDLKQYDIQTIEKDTGRGMTVPLSVLNEGKEDEKAFSPKFDQATIDEWKAVVDGEIADMIDVGTIKKGIVLESNKESRFAIIRAFVLSSDVISEKKYFVYDNGTKVKTKEYTE